VAIMLARSVAMVLVATTTSVAAQGPGGGSGRSMLFSTPGVELPDVYLSESVVFLEEDPSKSNSKTYTVVLTHPPGMREDETIDLDNDEVRIYLTSSQEHFQQDDSAKGVVFEQRRNHRTQLIIQTPAGTTDKTFTDSTTLTTNPTSVFGSPKTLAWGTAWDAANAAAQRGKLTKDMTSGAALGSNKVGLPLGPLPYVYKTFSTVGGNIPTQQSPVGGTTAVPTLKTVCPVCTHPAYCTLYDGKQHDLVNNPPKQCEKADTNGVSGCANSAVGQAFKSSRDIEVQTNVLNGAKLAIKAANKRASNAQVGTVRIIPGSVVVNGNEDDITGVGKTATDPPDFMGCYQVKITFAPVMDMCATSPTTVISDLNPLKGLCEKLQKDFTVYDGLLPRQAGGTHPQAVGWSYESPVPLVHSVPGNSDWRIDEIGDQILRTRSDPRPLCRYSNCPELTVNGGDQQPESKNFLKPSYSCANPVTGSAVSAKCGASWRGDLSSAAQLVFDSVNYATPQTVTVTARDDDVYEPEVNNRGQDAYVHHFVVAQDINLQHTYYDDIEVNDLTVSIKDNDPAVVIEDRNDVTPIEGSTDQRLRLRLASEPMYPVTVYLQSGSFFKPGEAPVCETVGAAGAAAKCNFQPDDEQVIFQDEAQYNTCWTTSSTVRTYSYPLVRDQSSSYRANASNLDHGGTFNYQGCFEDASGGYVLVNAPIDVRTPSPDTRQIKATMQCHGDDRCVARDVNLPNGAYPRDNYYEAREALVDAVDATNANAASPSGTSCQISACSNVRAATDQVGHYVETRQEAGSRVSNSATPTTTPGVAVSATPINSGGSTAAITAQQATAMRSCKWDGEFLTLRTYSSTGISPLPTTGYTCNSYVTFSTTNWNTWQALRVIGVNDDLDEGNFRISQIGFLYESIDYYYNSAGAKLITSTNVAYQPLEDQSTGVQKKGGTAPPTVSLSMFDTRFGKHINRYPRLATSDDLNALYSGADQKNLNTAPIESAWEDDDDYSGTKKWEGANGKNGEVWSYKEAHGGGAGYYGNPAVWGAPCHDNSKCIRKAPFHVADASNEVCCCEIPSSGKSMPWFLADGSDHADVVCQPKAGTTDPVKIAACNAAKDSTACAAVQVSNAPACDWAKEKTITGEWGAKVGSLTAEDPLQVQTFAPAEYKNRKVECGAKVTVTDNNVRGVTISRPNCEATEGRRFWFDTFQQEPTPLECDMAGRLYQRKETKSGSITLVPPMEITLGLFTAERENNNLYKSPSYQSFADTISRVGSGIMTALPSSGTIEGEVNGVCKTSSAKDACTASGESCTTAAGAAFAVTSWKTGVESSTARRWKCEFTSAGVPTGNTFSTGTASWQDGKCYKESTKAACATPGVWLSDNSVTVNNGLVVDTTTTACMPSCRDKVTGAAVAASDKTACDLITTALWDASMAEKCAGNVTRSSDGSTTPITCPSLNADGWTMADWPDVEYRGMTAPVCPYTITLDTSPLEGATVVVHLREDFENSNLRDHELYFYEEASYRPGVGAQQCLPELYPGSSWVNGGCFIHNVPVSVDNIPIPRGSTDLDVMFTDADWNVPRRITAIALNDDVDEPTELRTIRHTVGTCTGHNHNNDEACNEDKTYTGIHVSPVQVIVQDDDIADLVVIADDGYVCKSGSYDAATGVCSASEPNIIDESFIGSYDAAGPRLELTVNFWYQAFERQGPYAEDGISGSNFQGRSTVHISGVPTGVTDRASKWAVNTLEWVPAVASKCAPPASGTVVNGGTKADCLKSNGADPAKQSVYTPAVPAHCSSRTAAEKAASSDPIDKWTGALTSTACTTGHGSWPLIDGGNARGSIYNSGLVTSGTAAKQVYFAGHGVQIKDDGIGAGGFRLESQTGKGSSYGSGTNKCDGIEADATPTTPKHAPRTHISKDTAECALNQVEDPVRASITGGYITDNEDPLCLNPDPMLQDDRCFRIDDRPWSRYDPYWDIYTDDSGSYKTAPYDSTASSTRNVFDECTPVGQPIETKSPGVFKSCQPGHTHSNKHMQPNRGFKGIGPAYTEPEDEYAITVHSRECRHDTFGDTPASWGTPSAVFGSLEGGWTHGTQNSGADDYRKAPGTPEPGAFGEGEGKVDGAAANTDCVYGSFKVRLNSSPGTKHVRRRYVGEADTTLEEELVYVVITPDVTPQTMFDPVSVTFTHTGGTVEGKDTYRWDEPALFKVVPVDDEIDERAGVIVDFTSFTVTQSHMGDDYWSYTTPYQTQAGVGSMKEPSTTSSQGSTGRADTHTKFRHHIRTIHTRDNDYAGVTIESGVATAGQAAQTAVMDGLAWGSKSGGDASTANVNYNTHNPLTVTVTEGLTFAYYTLRLDSQPRKVQRQAGTNPNAIISSGSKVGKRQDYYHHVPGGRVIFDDDTIHTNLPSASKCYTGAVPPTALVATTAADCATAGGYWLDLTADPAGMYHALHEGKSKCDFEDFSDVTRPKQCGSVEPEQAYWVDVTATQSIHVDLAEPKSCPQSPPWGGGRKPVTTEHPRYPYNARNSMPINELTSTAEHLDGYLTTCGGWQRDATYRFTAADWNVPQYVYLYAHNDKDAEKRKSNHVDQGGNDNSGAAWTPGAAGTTSNPRGGTQQNTQTYNLGNQTLSVASGISTVLKHYVETEDTLDNMVATDVLATEAVEGYVQRNKHGAQYTSGNNERYPFGVLTDHVVGNTTGAVGAGVMACYDATGKSVTDKKNKADCEAVSGNTWKATTITNQPLTGVDNMQQPILTEPFGHRVTGFSTYGYSDYQWIYGYYKQNHTWTGVHMALQACGAVHMGSGIGHAGIGDPTNVGDEYTWVYPTSDEGDSKHTGSSCIEKPVTTSVPAVKAACEATPLQNDKTACEAAQSGKCAYHEFKLLPNADVNNGGTGKGWGGANDPLKGGGYVEPFGGEYCLDPFDNNKPYTQDGKHCVPVYKGGLTSDHPQKGGNAASPGLSGQAASNTNFKRAEPVRTSPGPNLYGVGPSKSASGATATGASLSWPTSNTISDGGEAAGKQNANAEATTTQNTGIETTYCVPKYATKNGGMKHPPADVTVIVKDNDIIADVTNTSITPCRQTSLFSSTSVTRTTTTSAGIGNMWLTDYNCKNGDAGGLPGYPVDSTVSAQVPTIPVSSDPLYGSVGDAQVPGDGQCTTGKCGPLCTISCP
jgi:hypothetical protein